MRGFPVRTPNRLTNYDYSQSGRYYITICAKERLEIFATIVDETVGAAVCLPCVKLTNVGHIIDIAIKNIPQIYPNVHTNTYVIMPNHLHMVLIIDNTNANGRQVAAPTIQTIIGQLKRYVTIQSGYSVWQKSFHDHIIRYENEYTHIVEYIENNPARWDADCFNSKSDVSTQSHDVDDYYM